jgi:hypothetical protein
MQAFGAERANRQRARSSLVVFLAVVHQAAKSGMVVFGPPNPDHREAPIEQPSLHRRKTARARGYTSLVAGSCTWYGYLRGCPRTGKAEAVYAARSNTTTASYGGEDQNFGRSDQNQQARIALARQERDQSLAKWLLVTHQPESWPQGLLCRNDRAPWPCRLHNWGAAVLLDAGWPDEAITEFIERAEDGRYRST